MHINLSINSKKSGKNNKIKKIFKNLKKAIDKQAAFWYNIFIL